MVRSLLYEGNSINQKALRALQSGETQGQAIRDLRQPETQAATRIED
jgi:hypothetical protein